MTQNKAGSVQSAGERAGTCEMRVGKYVGEAIKFGSITRLLSFCSQVPFYTKRVLMEFLISVLEYVGS